MTTPDTLAAGAPSHRQMGWHDINWAKCHQEVRRLQARIVKATREGRYGKISSLQYLLTHSFSGKALAVRRVTENQGKNTPGVDGKLWSTPETKFAAIESLKRFGYQSQPLKKVCIPKAKGIQKGIQQGKQEGINEGLQKGLEQGRKEAILELAKQLLANGVQYSVVKISTGLTDKELKSLSQKNNQND
ncbi:hypothetical protein GWK90_06960 [Candidatus Hamiltonella defensa]|uniref:Reverse transcriptase N-terminal domain-containing protein n=1 Tax=Candidatus Williamhamiltonella defendens TaxID=138072 RepID=A0AAC9VMA2_9ENTR|nr:reverse transcriptase N-terminal domain-containing protein [Candidatus Hamiltonella defensa]ASV34495.1 hypothetical protein CJJ18_10810 [Candidatus Hamiltonella defensa]AWK17450.1 hypothetical protein CCS40_10625 [Candidatus Hamiltonella defensa]MBK4361972.1 hypothetical protein [Candidatus Hamiltonella defensa]